MNTKLIINKCFGSVLCLITLPLYVSALETYISPTSRDRLFAAEKPIVCDIPIKGKSCKNICVKMKIPYDEEKDVNGRDINPKQGLPGEARAERLDNRPLVHKRIKIPYRKIGSSETLDVGTNEVGDSSPKDCKFATMWIHGAAFDKGDQGMNEKIFGGAFNRMQHLAADNGGMYYSPDIDDFSDADGLAAVVKYVRNKSCPNGKIIIACGSAGTRTCWKLAENSEVASKLGGLVFIASIAGPDVEITKSEIVKARVPIIIATGENDGCPKDHKNCGAYKVWENLVLKLHESDHTYPVRSVVFKDGGHMTPLRMLDWRQTLNCMLEQSPEVSANRKESIKAYTPKTGAK
ncbi:MAG: hypothetical protein ACXVCY_18115 [Pseudobdellovibrionaceae bacterium]